MIYCGVDPHKRKHVITMCDDNGKKLSSGIFNADIEGYQKMLEFVSEKSEERKWGIENPQSYGRGLAQYLVSKNENVFSVPPTLTSYYRNRSTLKEKNDSNDALAVSRALIQEGDKLPSVLLETETKELSILIEHYDNLRDEHSKIINRIHAYILTSVPYDKVGDLTSIKELKRLIEMAECDIEGVIGLTWKIIISISKRLIDVLTEMKSLLKNMEEILKILKADKLLEVKGIGVYFASKIIGIVGNPKLFRGESSFANYAGVSPISCSSGKNINYRVNPGGNRQLNYAIHSITLSKVRYDEESKKYYEKKQKEGKTKRESLRCLKRHVCKSIFNILVKIESINKIKIAI
jgi:transposase